MLGPFVREYKERLTGKEKAGADLGRWLSPSALIGAVDSQPEPHEWKGYWFAPGWKLASHGTDHLAHSPGFSHYK